MRCGDARDVFVGVVIVAATAAWLVGGTVGVLGALAPLGASADRSGAPESSGAE